MPQSPITEQELADYRAHIGHRIDETDGVAPEVGGRMAAAFGQNWAKTGDVLPPMWHYGLFLPSTPTTLLGVDGHPHRGDFLPNVRLPQRMFAGSDISFHAPLRAMQLATKISEVTSVDHRQGKTGDLVFVRVKISIVQQDTLCVEEEQTIVYRGDGPPMQAITPVPRTSASSGVQEEWTPSSVELFRFSAVTFNSHRIHYDAPYATQIEGYPALVVHGPLTAMRLCALAVKTVGPPQRFRFRGEVPLFVDQTVQLTAVTAGTECRLVAERCDGVPAMTATATF